MPGSQLIYDRRERLMVRAADAFLRTAAIASRPLRRSPPIAEPRHILLLRLERIGDLLMTLPAIAAVRARAPQATIHLAAGSWNAPVMPMINGIDSFETLDVPWLSRGAAGATSAQLARRALGWRKRRFDLAINFEPDIRSNVLAALSGAQRRVGFHSGGGGSLLTDALEFDPAQHTAKNAMRLVDRALMPSRTENESTPPFLISEDLRSESRALLGNPRSDAKLIGLHPSGGRLVKQWHVDRLAETGARLARELRAALVLTGTDEDRRLVDELERHLPPDVQVINLAGRMSLPLFAAVLGRLNLFVTPDTGPMHLAAVMGTPTVALFGPSDPARYGPLNPRARVVTADLWCRPCNRVRRPPERCTGHVPDCLDRISVEMVYRTAIEVASTSS